MFIAPRGLIALNNILKCLFKSIHLFSIFNPIECNVRMPYKFRIIAVSLNNGFKYSII